MINLDELTLGQVKEIKSLILGEIEITSSSLEQTESPFKIGSKWLFRTVTHIDTGEVVAVNGDLVTLKDAAWIADTGRFSDSLKDTSKFNEVEPYDDICVINVAALIDATPISKLTIIQK